MNRSPQMVRSPPRAPAPGAGVRRIPRHSSTPSPPGGPEWPVEHGRNKVPAPDDAAGDAPGVIPQRFEEGKQQGVEFKAEPAPVLDHDLFKQRLDLQGGHLAFVVALEIFKGHRALVGQDDAVQGVQVRTLDRVLTDALGVGLPVREGGIESLVHKSIPLSLSKSVSLYHIHRRLNILQSVCTVPGSGSMIPPKPLIFPQRFPSPPASFPNTV